MFFFTIFCTIQIPPFFRFLTMVVGRQLFRHSRCNILGMVHVGALPGSPASALPMPHIVEQATAEAAILTKECQDWNI
jgi:hypothetical protein